MPFFFDTRRPFRGCVSLARHGRLLRSKIIRETETIDSAGLHSFVPVLRMSGYDVAGFVGSLDNLNYILMI